MIDKVHVIGCGTLGSNLALTLAKYPVVKNLCLYDFDIVSRELKQYIFPYGTDCSGLSKVDVLEKYINILNSKIYVRTFNSLMGEPIKEDGLIIDCRDRKNKNIPSNLRLSLDGHMFIIDCLKDPKEFDFPSYCVEQKQEYVDLAISHAMAFILAEKYKKLQKVVYELDLAIDDYTVIAE